MARKKGECCPVGPDSVAKDYNDKVARTVKFCVKTEHEEFVPKYQDSKSSSMEMRVCLSKDECYQSLHPGNTHKYDCGFSVKKRPGYEFYVKGDSSLMSRGVMVTESFTEEDGYLKVAVFLTNTGRHIINVAHRDVVAGLLVRPVWYCDFVIKMEQ